MDSQEAVLDAAHIGDIQGAFGTISMSDARPRKSWLAKLRTLAAVIGPGLIVMIGDNDAGAFGTYTQAGQNFGTGLLWILLLLIPILYINQEMVLRLGAVTGVGHARLILERFGKFWGAFSIIDLFILNALTIVTEFIGIALGLNFLGVPKLLGVTVAAVIIMASAATGSFQRFERFSLMLCIGSLLLLPIFFIAHPSMTDIAYGFIPSMPSGNVSDIVMLIIAIVGTTIAPWQLFFQQSYIIDKRITPRFMTYEKIDLWIGILIAIIGAVAMVCFSAFAFNGHPEFGHFTDAGGIAAGLAKYVGQLPAALFAIGLIDASIIGAMAVSLSTAYAVGDMFAIKHSLHRKIGDAKGFYLVYCGLVIASAILVLVPDAPLGLITEIVQALAGILLPSATVFLLLLCNDKDVLGPWVNSRWTNMATSAVIVLMFTLSMILTVSVIFPAISSTMILVMLGGGCAIAIGTALTQIPHKAEKDTRDKATWRMPPLDQLPAKKLALSTRVWLMMLWGYLALTGGMILFRGIQMIY